jgi:hypothetical protein
LLVKATDMTAAQILAVNPDWPEKLFSSAGAIESEFRALALKWHPDTCREVDATAVAAHLTEVRAAAKKRAEAGSWRTLGSYILRHMTGKNSVFHYKRHLHTESGEIYYSRNRALFSVDTEYADLVHDGVSTINSFRYRDSAMRKEMSRFLPSVERSIETMDRRCNILVPKTDDVFLLADVQTSLGGRIDPKHVAWMLSGVYNIACYLEWCDLTHNAIMADTVFVSPKFHSCLLLGGWWYSAKSGARLSALPKIIHAIAPAEVLATKKANPRLDLAAIRLLGRTLLGDPTGMALLSSGVPAPMVTFLRHPSGSSARQDYSAWHAAVKASFGPRRFVELAVNENDIFDLEGE